MGGATSYQAIAQRLGKPGAARAVGRGRGQEPLANSTPLPPCFGADGALTGFALGLQAKRCLLTLEGIGWK